MTSNIVKLEMEYSSTPVALSSTPTISLNLTAPTFFTPQHLPRLQMPLTATNLEFLKCCLVDAPRAMNLERVKQKHARYWLSDSTASHVKGKDASLTSIICCHHWAIQTAGICIATTTDGLATAYRSASSMHLPTHAQLPKSAMALYLPLRKGLPLPHAYHCA